MLDLGRIGLVCLVLFVFKTEALAQRATMQGIISEYTSGTPLVGANVAIQDIDQHGRLKGAATDVNGFYQVTSIIPGYYEVKISFLGYETYIDTVRFRSDEVKNISIELKEDDEQLGEVVVTSKSGSVLRDEGRQRVTPVDLSRVPTPGANGDLVSYLQSLPGVVSLGSRGGQVFIRGGTPSENMVLVDGILMYKPFHIVGFFSPFSENLISSADFYAGGFSPQYTGRTASVLDISMRQGDRINYKGSTSISPFLADVMVEGPFQKEQSSWIISSRKSILQSSSRSLMAEEQPLKFESNFAKASFSANDVNCSFMGMQTYDRGRLDYEKDETIRWGNVLVGTQCRVLPGDTRTFLKSNVNFSHMWNQTSNLDFKDSFSRISRFHADVNMTQYRDSVRFMYGAFLTTRYMNYDIRGRFQDLDTEKYSMFNMGGHFELAIPIGKKLRIQPGIVASIIPSEYDPSYEPRFRASFRPFGRESEEIGFTAGIYRQPIVGISDMRDASSVFVIWMRQLQDNPQMQSTHYLLSWQQSIGQFNWSIEGYYKDLENIPIPIWTNVARVSTELSLANGYTYGSDLRLEYTKGRFYGLIGYGYNYTEYESAQDHFGYWFDNPVQSFNPPHDRRHQVNLTTSLEVGEIFFGLRWQLGTGVPFTQPIGFDEVIFYDDGLSDVRNTVGTRRVILDKPYEGRLPVYHRLDISAERDFNLSKSGIVLNSKVGVINAYDRRNLFFYDTFTDRRADQLPFVPYIALKIGN